ncbi:MAG: hypothetical protein GXO61_05450 [Epsilonproteobacteria bacterium]|nr:hypothetical protein [Campylobacterota bacterium]
MHFKYFFLVLILFFIGWVSWFEPYEIEPNLGKTAQIRFTTFIFYSLTPKGIEIMIKGDEATKNEERLRIKKVYITKKDGNGDEKILTSDVGVYKTDGSEIVELIGEVKARTKDFQLNSAKVDYHIKLGIIESNTIFSLVSFDKDIQVSGRKLTYNFKTKKLLASDIRARINLK